MSKLKLNQDLTESGFVSLPYLKQQLVILQQLFHHSYLHICLAEI